jgi:hypothetical protein
VSSEATNGNEHGRPSSSKGTIPSTVQLSLSDQLYRQSKIDEENRRLKKKSKGDNSSSKKGKKSLKKSDKNSIDDNDDDIYPAVQVTRGGELPEGVTESGNEDNDDDINSKKNKKTDPHRALNIDFNEKPIQSTPTPAPPKESLPEPIESPPVSNEKPPKKTKKKKTTEKEEQPSTAKPKQKRERSDYKELVSPVDEEEKPAIASPPVEEKPKKKKAKEKKPTTTTVDTNNSAPLLFDIMSDDIHPTNQSHQQYNEQETYKLAAQSDNLTIVRLGIDLHDSNIDIVYF